MRADNVLVRPLTEDDLDEADRIFRPDEAGYHVSDSYLIDDWR